jgi:SOS-response transcriptional repressor LexA/DNA-binding XRE family transcriptional regulator
VRSTEEFDEKKFGENLKELRKRKGLKIRELEALAKVSNAYLSQLENGKRGKPSPEIIKKLAPHLGVTYTELMKLAGYITEDINQDALELLKLEEIEEVFKYAFEQFFNGISDDGEVIKEFRESLIGQVTEMDANVSEFFSEENMKTRGFWEELFDQLTFQEKLEFLLLLKKDVNISPVYKTSKEEDKNVLESTQNYYSKNDIESPGKTVQVPILGYIAAGQPIFADEHIIDYEELPGEFNKDHFMLIVKGDSMKGSRIYPGDKVLVKMQPEVENGEIAVVNVSGEDATLKKVKKYEDGSVWLISTNEKYAPIPLQRSSRIIGKVIKVIFEP